MLSGGPVSAISIDTGRALTFFAQLRTATPAAHAPASAIGSGVPARNLRAHTDTRDARVFLEYGGAKYTGSSLSV
jgi:hypothetical protein